MRKVWIVKVRERPEALNPREVTDEFIVVGTAEQVQDFLGRETLKMPGLQSVEVRPMGRVNGAGWIDLDQHGGAA